MIVRALTVGDERVCSAPTGTQGKQKFQVCAPDDDAAAAVDNNNKFMHRAFRASPTQSGRTKASVSHIPKYDTCVARGIRDLQAACLFLMCAT